MISGTSTPTGKFYGCCAVLSSHEDGPAWTEIYKYVRNLGFIPSSHMGDGAKAITLAGKETYGDVENCSRLMCYSHVHRNMTPQMKSVSTLDKGLADRIISNIENLQWSVHNEDTFFHVWDLLKKKYENMYNSSIDVSIKKFLDYMDGIWIESDEFRWFEGANLVYQQ